MVQYRLLLFFENFVLFPFAVNFNHQFPKFNNISSKVARTRTEKKNNNNKNDKNKRHLKGA